MNVYLIHCIDFPNGTAGSAHAKLIVQGMRKNKVNTTLIIPYGTTQSSHSNNTKLIGHQDGVPFYYSGGSTVLPKNYRFLFLVRAMIRTSILLFKKRKRLDSIIIGTPDFIIFLPIIIICIFSRIKFFIWTVELMSSNEEFRGIKGIIRYISALIAERIFPHLSDGYIVISSFLNQFYKKINSRQKLLISPILVDINYSPLKKQATKNDYGLTGKKIILYSGTFAEKDGFIFILESFAKLCSEVQDVMLVTTGNPVVSAVKEIIIQTSEDLNISDKVKHLGYLYRDELQQVMNIADILLVYRTKSIFAQYGLPWKLGEYCYFNKPIIASKIGDLPNYFEDLQSIFFVEPENPEALYKKMLYIFNNYSFALKVAQKGHDTALKKFDHINETKKIIEFIT
jgi:glycosyltransferase involved in cell wall biosynthesis